jgi:hypothetical protein
MSAAKRPFLSGCAIKGTFIVPLYISFAQFAGKSPAISARPDRRAANWRAMQRGRIEIHPCDFRAVSVP